MIMSSLATDDAIEGSRYDQPRVAGRTFSQIWSREFIELLVTQFAFGLGFSIFYLLPKYLRLEFRATASQIGLVMGTGLVAAVAATPFTALWLGRGVRRMPALVGLTMLCVSALGFMTVTRLGPLLLVLRALQGFAACLFISAMVARAAEIVPKSRLGQSMGYLGLASLVTNALSPLVAEPVAAHYGWSKVFLIAAGWCLLAFVLAARLSDNSCAALAKDRGRAAQFDRQLPRMLYATIICGVALGVMFTYSQPLALERGASDVGRLFSGYVVGAATVRLLLSSLADRVGRGRVSIGALLGYALAIALTLRITPQGLAWVGLGFGASHGLLYPALNAMVLERATEDNRGLIATMFGGAFNLGYAASVLGLGVVADAFGYGYVFIGAAILTLTGAAALFGIK
jgi:MFS family permease